MEYKVVEEPTILDLIREVNAWVTAGWQPQGGIAVAPSGETYLQAMIRPADAILPSD